jgi:hypothetical protein
MGAMDIEQANGFALIEMRGYVIPNSSSQSVRQRKFEDIAPFIKKEADWFFPLYRE